MREPSVHDLAEQMAEAFVRLQECQSVERDQREKLRAVEAETRRAETALINARNALDKATGVESGMFGEAYVGSVK